MVKHRFWDSRKSILLSIIVTWTALVLAVAMIPALIPLLRSIRFPGANGTDRFVLLTAYPLFICLGCGIATLIILLGLLSDIRKGEIFTLNNVRRLRLISYFGFAIMVACIIGAFIAIPFPLFIFLAMVAGFLALLMRVVKNVIDSARLLKEDADFTI
ncbi:MAG: DUF2975 domain-containing protein [Propionibacteriaceae bacterium]|nr:DUF2975 domain-containing protein [Propionibacteriaceae bacterium]